MRIVNRHILSRFVTFIALSMFCLIALSNSVFALTDYNDPLGYPAPWPDTLVSQTYTAKGQSQNDITGNPDPSRSASLSGSADFSSGARSGAGEGTVPSFFYSGDGSILFVRWRVDGPPQALTGASQPFGSGTWNLLFDTDGDGYKEFIVHIDGGSGATANPDDIVVIYTNSPSQSFTVGGGQDVVWRQDSARNPGDRSGATSNGEPGGSTAWKTNNWTSYGSSTNIYVLDFGYTRVVQIDQTLADGSNGSEYYLDIQIPIAALDATAKGGPKITSNSRFTLCATTSNSNTDPTQKDLLLAGQTFSANSTSPIPFGDILDPAGNITQDPIVTGIQAGAGCTSPALLTNLIVQVLDTLTISSSIVVDTIATVNYYYWYDSNTNLLTDDDGSSWIFATNGVRSASLGEFTNSWMTTNLANGAYLLKVIATDTEGHTTDSSSQSGGAIYGVMTNTCGVHLADVRTSKIGPSSAVVTSNIVYTITLTNLGPLTASNIIVIDALPLNGTKFVSATGGGTSNNGAVTWPTLASFASGAGTNFTLTLQAPANAVTLTNIVSSSATTTDNVLTNNNGTGTNAIVITTVAPEADVKTSKTGPASVNATSNIVYTITITNMGPSAASNIVVSDNLPLNGTLFVSATGGGTSNNGAITWPSIMLTNGAVTNFTLTLSAPGDAVTLTNIILSTADTTDSVLTNNNGTGTNSIVTTTVTPIADLFTSKSGPASVNVTSNIVYTITVTNLGPSTASNIVVSDALPLNGTMFVSATGGGVSNNGAITWPSMLLTNGAVTNFTLTLLAPTHSVTLTNIITSTSDTTDLVATNNNGSASNASVTTTVVPIADLMTTKTGPASVSATSNLVYTITVTNLGPSSASNIVVSDTLPLGISFVSATGSGVSNNGTVTWPAITSLTNGAVTNFTITLTAPVDYDTLTNIVLSTSSTADLVATNNNGSASDAIVITTVSPEADLKTIKTGPVSVNATSNIVYTISLTNLGPSTASNVVVSDVLPTDTIFVSATGGGISNNGAVVWPTITTFTNGAVTNFTVTLTAPSNAASLTNIVSSTSTTSDNVSTNNNGTASDSIVMTAVLSIADIHTSKTGPASVNATSNIVYTITMTNLGPSTASNVVVSDVLPANTIFISATDGGTSNNGAVTWPSLTEFTNGAVASFTLTLQASTNAATLTNIVSSISSTTDLEGTNNDGTASDAIVETVVIAHADLLTTKTGPASVTATSNIVYSITVTNLGPSTASNIVVSDTLPLNISFVSATGGGVSNNGVVTWPTITSLTSGQAADFTLTLQAPAEYGTLTNIISSLSTTTDLISTNNDGTAENAIVITTISPEADVQTTKAGPASINATSNVVYTITVTNFGPSTASNVVVSDVLPTNTVFVSASDGGFNNSGTVTWPTIAGFGNGAVTNFTLTVTAPAEAATLSNVVFSTSTTTDPISTNNNGSATNAVVITAVVPQADIKTIKMGPSSVGATSNIVYTITVTNIGPSMAADVVVSDTLPANVVFISASNGGTENSGVVTWPTIAALTNGAATEFTVTVQAPAESMTLTNTVSSTAATGDLDTSNNDGTAPDSIVITTVSPFADIITTKIGPATVNATNILNYTITVTNAGPSTASNIVVSDSLPFATAFLSASSGGSSNNGAVTWPTISTLPNGGFTNYTVTLRAPASGVLTNIISSTADTIDPVPANNNGTSEGAIVISTVIAMADLKTTKTGPASVNAGQSLTYTITLTNLGPSTATNVIVTDVLPAGTTLVSASAGGATNSNGELIWPTISSLAAGDGADFTLVLTAPGDGTLTNVVSSTSSTIDPLSNNNNGSAPDATVITTIIPSADVQTTKSGPPTVNLTSNIVYTITVTNFGPSIAAGVVVSDALPSGVTFVSATSGGSHNAGTVTWPSMSLAGSGGTNFTLTVQATTAGTITNIVSSTSSTTDPTPGNNDGSSSSARVVTSIGARSISGKVYIDGNLNKKWDNDETGTGLTFFAKLIPSSSPSGPATQAASVDPTTGVYVLSNLLPDTYIVIIDDNNTLSDVTPTIPASWVGTEIPNQKRENILVNNVNVVNQNFGLAEAATIVGKVFKDTGLGSGGIANDGILNGTEAGISGVTVKLTDASGSTVYATTITDGAGLYTIYIPNSIANGTSLKVTEVNLSSYRSIGGAVGNTAGTYNRSIDTVTFTRVGNNSYTEVNFGDVPDNQFINDGQQAGLPGSAVFYSHIFTAGTAGQVTFSMVNTANPSLNGWSQVLYRDSNCNGKLDPGEQTITGAITVATDEKICIIVKEFIPHGAPLGAQDQVVVTASFDYSNANPSLTATYTRTDLTTVGTPTTTGLTLAKTVDKATALPGETLTYTITYSNSGADNLNNVVVYDNTPAYTVFVSAANGALPDGLTAVATVTPAVNTYGGIKWTFTGSLPPGARGTVTFQVKLE